MNKMTSSNEAGDNQINVGPQLADTNYKNYVLEVILYLTGGAYVEFQSGLVLDSCLSCNSFGLLLLLHLLDLKKINLLV